MIDRDVFNRHIAVLAELYRHDLSLPVIEVYYALLSARLTTEQFVAAARRVAMSERFWPAPGLFLPPVHERLTVEELDAQAVREGLPVPVRQPLALPAGPVIHRLTRPTTGLARAAALLAAPTPAPEPRT